MRTLTAEQVGYVSGGAIGGGYVNGIPLLSSGGGQESATIVLETVTVWGDAAEGGGITSSVMNNVCNWAGAVSGVAAATITGAAGVTLPVVGLVGLGVAGSVERICTLGVTAATGGIPTSHPR
jgi:hypothetical protein